MIRLLNNKAIITTRWKLHGLLNRLSKLITPVGQSAIREFKPNPELKFVSLNYVSDMIANFRKGNQRTLIDIGGRKGEFASWAKGYKYYILDIEPSEEMENVITADICKPINDQSQRFDVIFSNNTFEHLNEPKVAAENCISLLKSGGLLVCIAPFSARFHPSPSDYFRYTHKGLEYIFTNSGEIETLFAGYQELSGIRRADKRGGKDPLCRDVVPIDELGGWRENWRTIFIGKKIE